MTDGFQPRFLPEDQAAGLAAAVGGSIAARFEVDGLIDSASSHWKHGVAGLVRSFIDLKSLAAEREHLGHERHAIELSLLVERPQNLFLASDLYPVGNFWFAHLRVHNRIRGSERLIAAPST